MQRHCRIHKIELENIGYFKIFNFSKYISAALSYFSSKKVSFGTDKNLRNPSKLLSKPRPCRPGGRERPGLFGETPKSISVAAPDGAKLGSGGDFSDSSPRNHNWLCDLWEESLVKKEFLSSVLPSGKRLHNYGKIHHFEWVNPLFQWSMFNRFLHGQSQEC